MILPQFTGGKPSPRKKSSAPAREGGRRPWAPQAFECAARASSSQGAPAARGRRAGGARPWRGGDAARAPPSCREPLCRPPLSSPLERGGSGGSEILEARLAPSVSSSAKRTTSSTSPPPRGNVRMHRGESKNVRARASSAHALGAERVARGSDSAAAGNRARSAHALGA